MTKEEDIQEFAAYLQEHEKTVMNLLVQHFINNKGMKLNTSNDSNANLNDALHDINSKPIVAMKLSDEETGNEAYFRALLDPGSFSNSTQEKIIVGVT